MLHAARGRKLREKVCRFFRICNAPLDLPQYLLSIGDRLPGQEHLIRTPETFERGHQLIVALDDSSNPAHQLRSDAVLRHGELKHLFFDGFLACDMFILLLVVGCHCRRRPRNHLWFMNHLGNSTVVGPESDPIQDSDCDGTENRKWLTTHLAVTDPCELRSAFQSSALMNNDSTIVTQLAFHSTLDSTILTLVRSRGICRPQSRVAGGNGVVGARG